MWLVNIPKYTGNSWHHFIVNAQTAIINITLFFRSEVYVSFSNKFHMMAYFLMSNFLGKFMHLILFLFFNYSRYICRTIERVVNLYSPFLWQLIGIWNIEDYPSSNSTNVKQLRDLVTLVSKLSRALLEVWYLNEIYL